MVTKKAGRPKGTGKVQQLESDVAAWRDRAVTAEHNLQRMTQDRNAERLRLERDVADARKLAKDTTAKLNTMHEALQAVLRSIMQPSSARATEDMLTRQGMLHSDPRGWRITADELRYR